VTLVAPPGRMPNKRFARARTRRKTFAAPKFVTTSRVPLLLAPPPAAAPIEAPIVVAAAPRILEPPAIAPPPAMALPAPQNDLPARLAVQTGGFEAVSTTVVSASSRATSSSSGFGDASISRAGVTRGAVSAAGFGDARTTSASAVRRGTSAGGGFGDVVTTSAPAPARYTPAAAPVSAAQILDKPRPVYTEEARRLQIEGEVQIELIFGASGEIRILRVVQGLGMVSMRTPFTRQKQFGSCLPNGMAAQWTPRRWSTSFFSLLLSHVCGKQNLCSILRGTFCPSCAT
jgi:outer membrane biosynthesis protein TonB